MANYRRSIASVALPLLLLLGAWTDGDVRAADGAKSSQAAAFNPVDEIYQISETRRQDLIARQLDLNYRMSLSAGYGPRYPNPFEPWPRVPGDIWGYPMPRPIEQPIGHESLQTGPNRWTYRPLYAADVMPLADAAEIRASQRAALPAKVQLPGPSDLSEPVPPNPPPSKPRRALGPREF
jgi:hypothetical protein